MTDARSEPDQPDLEIDEPGPPLIHDQGETEDDLESHELEHFEAAMSATDWTVETLVSQLRKGRIDLNPRFQRRNAWLDTRKSQLIESILLRYPIPQLVLAEKSDQPGSYFVLDGKQRLLTLRQFFALPDETRDAGFLPLRLRGLEILGDLNGMVWSVLDHARPDLAARLENHTIRTVVLSQWKSEDFLLSLFLRLNTGSVTLSPQELRQALHPGPFTDWLDDASAESPGLRVLLGNTQPDRRMVDAELLLRFLALLLSPRAYKSNLKRFWDDSSGVFNDDWIVMGTSIRSHLQSLEDAIAAAQQVFPDGTVCRKWAHGRWERPFNRALFDVQMVSLADPSVRERALEFPDRVVDVFKRLCETDTRFVGSITATTKTGAAFRTRLEAWNLALSRSIGVQFASPPCFYREEST